MRLFIAVRPPADVIELLAAAPRRRIPGARWTTAEHWHVTLRFFGEIDDPSALSAALRMARLPRATATMGPKVKYLGHLIWMPVAGLDELAAAVVDVTRTYGKPPDRRKFRGHITLLRQRSDGNAGHLGWEGGPLEASWTVRDIELIRSHLGRGPARYETLERFELGGAAR